MNNEYVQWLDSHVENWQSITNDEERLFLELDLAEAEKESIRMYIDSGVRKRAIFLIRENGIWKKLGDHFWFFEMPYVELPSHNFDRSQPESEFNPRFNPITVDQIDNEILGQTALDELPVMAMWSYDGNDTVCLRYYDEKHNPVTDKQQLSAIIKAVDISNDYLSLCKDDIHSKVVLITAAQEVDEMRSEYIRNKYNH